MDNASHYRPSAGIMLIDRRCRVFIGRRAAIKPAAWQMPQGGIEEGEDIQEAARRELLEETGIHRVCVIAVTNDWLTYDLPANVAKKSWGGKFRGQRQKWVLMRFQGTDRDIDFTRHGPPEFEDHRWVDPASLPGLVISFKRAIYERVISDFRPYLEAMAADKIDHVQVTVPRDAEVAAINFYGGLVGLKMIDQPKAQAEAGGAWFSTRGMQIHLKPDDTPIADHLSSKRHIALTVPNLDGMAQALVAAGYPILPDPRPIPGVTRFFVRDPGGNRVEIIQNQT